MRIWRLTLAVLLATGLAVLQAKADAAMAHPAKAEMSMNAPDDGCAPGKSVQTGACSTSCCQTPALSVEPLSMVKPGRERFVARAAEPAVSVSRRPDPPPPRS